MKNAARPRNFPAGAIIRKLAMALAVVFFVCSCSGGGGGSSVDTAAKYLFYLHGGIVEQQGANAVSPQHGPFDYEGILQAFRNLGYTVQSEVRPSETVPADYGAQLAARIRSLITSGVPAANVSVAGFSKGGLIAFYTSASLQDGGVTFVILAGCGIGQFANSYQQMLATAAPFIRGRFLSMYDLSDDSGGTCQQAFTTAGGAVTAQEITLQTGLGHGVFYNPLDEWVDPVNQWIGQQ